MTIKKALLWGTQQLNKVKIKSALLDAEILLLYTLNSVGTRRGVFRRGVFSRSLTNYNKSYLYTHPERQLTKSQLTKYQRLIVRRAKKEPLAYITQYKEFYGLDFYDVFSPK